MISFVITIFLCGLVSADISEILYPSREYLPPSREYLPPLLPDYLENPPVTSTYVQDPPIITNSVEILSTIGPDNTGSENSSLDGEVFIPVQVVIENNSENGSSLRQYLPPLNASSMLPESSETPIKYDQTTPQIVANKDGNAVSAEFVIENKEFIQTITPDIINNENTTPTESTEIDSETVTHVELDDIKVLTSTLPDVADSVTTDSIGSTSLDAVTLRDDSGVDQDISNESNESTLTTTQIPEYVDVVTEIKDAIQHESTTVIALVAETFSTLIETITKSVIDDIETVSTTKHFELTSTDTSTVNEVTVGEDTDADAISSINQQISISDGPTTTSLPSVDKIITESGIDGILTSSTTIPEYIRNSQKLMTATDGDNLEVGEMQSKLIATQDEVATPETLLLEDGYHYSIPSITF